MNTPVSQWNAFFYTPHRTSYIVQPEGSPALKDGWEVINGSPFSTQEAAQDAAVAEYTRRMTEAGWVRADADLRSELEGRETDIRMLLAQLDYLRQVTGEGVEEEDAALVEGIRASLPVLSPIPTPGAAS